MVVFVPLLVNPWAQTSFEIIKNTTFRGVVEIMVLAWLVKKIANFGIPYRFKHGSVWNNGIVLTALIAMLVTVLATLMALNVHLSFFGSYVRMQGLFTQLHYWALFGLIISEFKNSEDLWEIITYALIGGFLVSVIGLFQMTGVDPISLLGSSFSSARLSGTFRVLSTLGQPNFLGQYLIMLMPFAVAGIFRGEGRGKRYYYGVVGAMFVVIVGTLSRSAWLGLIAAGLFFGFGYLLKRKRIKLIKITSGVLAILLAGFLFINIVDTPLKDSGVPAVRRITKVLDSKGATSQSRLYNWYTAFRASSFSPFIGFGPESYNYLYSKFQPEEILAFEASDKFADRAHNIFLDRIVTVGYLGLLASIIFGLTLLVVGLRVLLRSADYNVVWVLLASLSSLIAFFVSDLFGFALVVVNMLFWLVVGMMVVAINIERGVRAEKIPQKEVPMLMYPVYLALLALTVWLVIAQNVALNVADVKFKRGICGSCDKGNVSRALELAPEVGYYGYYRGFYLVKDAERSIPVVAEDKYMQALDVFADSFAKSQRAGDYYLNLARLYVSWEKIDESKGILAEDAYEKASGATPKKPRLYKEWAEYLASVGKFDKSLQVYGEFARLYHADQDRFTMNQTLKDYADLAKQTGDINLYERAQKLYFQAEKLRDLIK